MSEKKTISPRQIAASQANGRHSTGPATEQGLQNSRFGRLRHGFYTRFFEEAMVALGEDQDEFKRLEQDLIAYWHPAGAFRESLVRRLARVLWKLEREDNAESGETVRQLEALQANCDSRARQIEAQARPLLADLEYLLDAVRRRDLSEGDDLMFAFNRLGSWRKTPRLERAYRLLCEEENDAVEHEDGGNTEAAGDAGFPDEDDTLTADQENACAEAEALLQEELQRRLAEAESRKGRHANPSAAEWSARLVPQSPLLIRWQDSLGRQAERLIKLLSDLEAQDKLRPKRDRTKTQTQAEGQSEILGQR